MKRSLDLTSEQRTALLDLDRGCPDPDVRFRSHILLLLSDGQTWATVSTLRYCSSRTIDRWVKRFHAEGVEAAAGHRPGRRARLDSSWLKLAVEWVTQKAPRDFGFLRGRWCREAVAVLIRQLHHVDTGRTWLRKGGRVYRRPRPARMAALTRSRAGSGMAKPSPAIFQAGRGPTSPGRWHPAQFFSKIGATSLL